MQAPKRIFVKVCGITSTDDAQFVCASGVDAIGLVFYEKSPRNVTIQQAKEITQSLPAFVSSVGLFMDASETLINTVLEEIPLDLLQFHGTETAEFCESFGRPYIKAIGMADITSEEEFGQLSAQYKNARGLLVDSHSAGKAGGTGETFDWKNVPQNQQKPIILAGGLNPDNIADAIQQNTIYGIDLSSGVESQPGKKDPNKIHKLMTEVYRVQCNKT